jgi:hypothetical protein
MQTYSHLILTAALHRALKQQAGGGEAANDSLQVKGVALPPLRAGALMWGSVAPDLPLILLTFIYIGADTWAGRSMLPEASPAESYVAYLFDYLFFHNRWVMTLHNLFHGPLMILFYLAAGYWGWKLGRRWAPALFWFALSCGLHTAIDIPLHTDDGPLLLFPFYWEERFRSPISYWDPAYYGRLWFPLEHLVMFGLLIYLLITWWRARKRKAAYS